MSKYLVFISKDIMFHGMNNTKRTRFFFRQKITLNLRKELWKCYIWSVVFYGAQTWTVREVDQKYLESLICGAGEGWRRSVGPID